MPTIREHRPLGYDATQDRRQAGRGCAIGTIPILIGLVVCAVSSLVWGFSQVLNQPPATAEIPTLAALATDEPLAVPITLEMPSATPSATLTPDSWGLTGTALVYRTPSPTPPASATLDYCWWQTPSPTPTNTLPFTPDAWAATGTAIYVATNPYRTPTPPPARELCDFVPTWTPTLTPLPLDGEITYLPAVTKEVSPAYTLPVITPPSTWTPPPGPTIIYQEVTVPAPEPVIVTSAPVVITSPPIIIQPPPQVIVITATLAPPTATPTSSPTMTPSPTPTSSPTATPSATPTSSPTMTSEPTEESTETL